ncbi:MAG: hypothetical protein R3C25_11730 [Hyphomonadaceae bacterium]
MADVVNIVARMLALEAGRAQRVASHLQFNIQPHALVICPLAMAGEDTTIHAVAIGAIGAEPQIRVVPDPRVRDDQYGLVRWMGDIIEAYYARCRANGDYPQIWAASGAAAGHLDVMADRLRFVRDNAPIQRVGALLTYATERAPVEGQQALMTMTGALSAHYATGQQEGEDQHLGAVLVWLDPPADGDTRRAVAIAEREVMGVKTDPDFDRDVLQPLVSRYHQSLKSGANAAQMQVRVKAIEDALSPIVARIYAATQRGFAYLIDRFPPSGVLAQLHAHEAAVFESFMQARDGGMPLPYRDTPKAGAFKIAEREHAAQSVAAGSIYGDAMAQARARMAGDILMGAVRDVTLIRVGRKRVFRFIVDTAQQNLHMRARDELAWLQDPRLKCVIEGVDKQGPLSSVRLRVSAGMNAVGAPQDGAVIELGPPPPDWRALGRERVKMASRLANTPWTHARDAAPPAPSPRRRPISSPRSRP